MEPSLREGRVVFAWTWFRTLEPQNVVIVRHGGLEKIKRIQKIKGKKVFVVGDNQAMSTDSRQFGWINRGDVVARVL